MTDAPDRPQRTIFYTATTLDGFIADPDDSLAWLLRQDLDQAGPLNYDEFFAGVGALVMGSTTFTWVLDHEDGRWPYALPTWVMTTRELAGPTAPEGAEAAPVHFARGPVADLHATVQEAAGDKDVWVVGGGDLAGQFADAGLLDELIVYVAPVTLGAGRPLLPRRLDLELLETHRNEGFVATRYRVAGALTEDREP